MAASRHMCALRQIPEAPLTSPFPNPPSWPIPRPAPAGTAPRLAWLFDIDGTLLLTEGASRQAFSGALRERLGVDDDLAGIAFAGRTEPLILADILARIGRRFEDGDEARFWDAVFAQMRMLLHPGRGLLMPGVPAILDAIDQEPQWVSGLLTGNMTRMAEIKLARFQLEHRFAFGAFGQEAVDRNALARVAVERVRTAYGVPPSRCIVVGDTEHDIACARAAGARVVAVATGSVPRAVLAEHAPDMLFDDLGEFGALLEWAREVARGV
jgi:phosphoglycolate phosphatase-like HAD superfamily hydrolase